MDLRLYLRVLWRFRLLVAAGLVFALALSILATVRFSFENGRPVVTSRGEHVWISNGRVLVTQAGFPQGRLNLGGGEDEVGAVNGPQFADPARFAELAVFYARLAETAPVRTLVFRQGPIEGAMSVDVAPVEDPNAGTLPLIHVTALGTSREAAIVLARRQMAALREYVRSQQVANRIAPANRVILTVVDRPGAGAPPFLHGESNTWLLSGPSLMRPAMVFIAIMGLVVGLAFVLENVRPRIRTVTVDAVADDARPRARSA